MDLQDAHNWIRYILKKERGGFITPPEIDTLLHRAQMWEYTSLFKVYGKTQKIQDALGVFSQVFTFTSTVGGLVVLPIDPTVNPCYEYLLSIYVQYYDNNLQLTRQSTIKILSEDEIAERLNSQILTPTAINPVGIETEKGKIQLYPQTTLAGKGYYLRLPAAPFFSYTMTGRAITYNAANSVQMEWNESSINKILIKAIQFAGVNLTDNTVVGFAETKNQEDI